MSDNAQNAVNNQTNENNAPSFDVLRIYIKDCSFETPNVPKVFTAEWKPEMSVDFDTKLAQVDSDKFEVDLRVTVTCKLGEEVAYICEVHQAGIFLMRNVNQDTGDFLLNGVAPNILFPYAREHISSLVNRGTFPPLNLRPINFEALFQAQKAQQAQEAAQKSDVANGEANNEAPQA